MESTEPVRHWLLYGRFLVLLDPRVTDQLFPQYQLLLQERVELFRRARERLHAAFGELALDVRPLDDFADFGVQFRDDLFWHIGWTEIALPRGDVETLDGRVHGR